jgi:hypothetical protein
MGITVEFPNGVLIFTSNFVDGAFTVDVNGRILAKTNLVANEAFSAGGTVENSNLPGSGPGGNSSTNIWLISSRTFLSVAKFS